MRPVFQSVITTVFLGRTMAKAFTFVHKFIHDELGSYLVFLTISMPVLIGVAALGTEGAYVLTQHRAAAGRRGLGGGERGQLLRRSVRQLFGSAGVDEPEHPGEPDHPGAGGPGGLCGGQYWDERRHRDAVNNPPCRAISIAPTTLPSALTRSR